MKQTIFLATIRNESGEPETRLYTAHTNFIRDTFSPVVEVLSVLPLCVHGKTYSERKASAEQTAIEYSQFFISDLSYYEYSIVSAFFEKIGKRYGLLTDFRENGIC